MTSETVAEEEAETAEDVVNEVMPEGSVEPEEQETSEQPQEAEKKEDVVPVSALTAERKKRQEEQERARWLEQQLMQQQQAQQQSQIQENPDDLVTAGQQSKTLNEWKRSILEEAYMEQNPEIIERIKTELPEILNDPRHKWLADSLPQAPNRLQRAAQILEIVRPKEEPRKKSQPPPDRTNTPRSPQSVAKTNKLSMADRIMEMSDQELEEWRVSQKRKVR